MPATDLRSPEILDDRRLEGGGPEPSKVSYFHIESQGRSSAAVDKRDKSQRDNKMPGGMGSVRGLVRSVPLMSVC